MFLTKSRKITLGMILSTSCYLSIGAHAGTILVYEDTLLGVNDQGHLNYSPTSEQIALLNGLIDDPLLNSNIGLYKNGLGDATSPGCLCEGWGVAVTTSTGRVSGYASIDNGGTAGLMDTEFTSTVQTARSSVNLVDTDVNITHAFGPSLAAGVFQAQITITNNTDESLDDLVYRRAMDWDIPPTEFSEYVTHQGVEANLVENGGNVLYASDNGFQNVNPLIRGTASSALTVNSDFIDNGPSDHGSLFDFYFPELGGNDSRTFNIFYGATDSETAALSAVDLLGIDVYSFGQQSGDPDTGTPATFLFGFGGVGGIEPGETANNPILPFVPELGEFLFTDPLPGRWYDPPFAEGFSYTLDGGGTFSEIRTPDVSFGFGDVEIFVGGVLFDTVAPDEVLDLSALATDSFELYFTSGKTLDIAASGFATAFPLFLDWTGVSTGLSMSSLIAKTSPVNAPSILIILILGVGCVFVRKR